MCGSIGIFFAIEKDIYTPPDTQRQSGNLMICGKVSQTVYHTNTRPVLFETKKDLLHYRLAL